MKQQEIHIPQRWNKDLPALLNLGEYLLDARTWLLHWLGRVVLGSDEDGGARDVEAGKKG